MKTRRTVILAAGTALAALPVASGCAGRSAASGLDALEAAPAPTPTPSRLAPSPGMGRVRLVCDPADADVVVDDVTRGIASDFAAPRFLELTPGPHRIEVRKDGFATYRAEVYVAEEVTETIPVTLRRLPAASAPVPKEKEQ